MAVSAYASVLSLKEVIRMVGDMYDVGRITEQPQGFESLEPIVVSLQEFLEKYDSARVEIPPEMKDVLSGIPPAALEIHFHVDLHVVYQLSRRYLALESESASAYSDPLDLLIEKAKECVERGELADDLESLTITSPVEESTTYSLITFGAVNSQDDLESVILEIISPDPNLGLFHFKTRLGEKDVLDPLLQEPRINNSFGLLLTGAWLPSNISYTLRTLRDIDGVKVTKENEEELKDEVLKRLSNLKYCIFLWDPLGYGNSHENNKWFMEELKLYLPDDFNGSRVILIEERYRNLLEHEKSWEDGINCEGDLESIISEITRPDPTLRIFHIRTDFKVDCFSLADSLRIDQRVAGSFELLFCATKSSRENILQYLGRLLGVDIEKENTEELLKDKVLQGLSNHKFCIFMVLNSIWCNYEDFSNKLKCYLPDDLNGSRLVVITTRIFAIEKSWEDCINCEGDLESIISEITRPDPTLRIFQIRTDFKVDRFSLADSLRIDQRIAGSFDLLFCANVSPGDNILQYLGHLLGVDVEKENTEELLKDKVLQGLSNHKFCLFMILDLVVHSYGKLLKKLKCYLPDDLKGSRLVLITNALHSRIKFPFRRKISSTSQLRNLLAKVECLKRIMEDSPKCLGREMKTLIREICATVEKSSEVLDKQVSDQHEGIIESREALDMSIKNLESIKTNLLKFNISGANSVFIHSHSIEYDIDGSTTTISSTTFEKYVEEIMSELTRNEKSLQVIPIVGMGGIGKTTLARFVFDKSATSERFDRLYWCTISQQYSIEQVLRSLLSREKSGGGNQRELGQILYQQLCGRRYLIVMDDMWESEVYENLRSYLPHQDKGSRIIVTTRMKRVANSVKSSKVFVMGFLDVNESWTLLKKQIFEGDDCPNELEKIGKRIARNCGGLPISLVTMGGLLKKSSKNHKFWENVEQNVKKAYMEENEKHCTRILSMSYEMLPIHLKTCYLYFAFFKEDERVNVKRLMQDWIANGLVKSEANMSMLDCCEAYLKDLIDRNLVLIYRENPMGKIKSCGLHDLLWELCKSKVALENFLAVDVCRVQKVQLKDDYWNYRCNLCSKILSQVERVDLSYPNHIVSCGSMSLMGVRICKRCEAKHPYFCKSKFVNFLCTSLGFSDWQRKYATLFSRVVANCKSCCRFGKPAWYGLTGICQTCRNLMCTLSNLKMVFIEAEQLISYSSPTTLQYVVHNDGFYDDVKFISPSPILYLWKLQFIWLKGTNLNDVCFPQEIWEMQQLMYLRLGFELPYPEEFGDNSVKRIVLKELRQLYVRSLPWTTEVLKRIPNLIKLETWTFVEKMHIDDINASFHQLESLKLKFCKRIDAFPSYRLKRLSLYSWKCDWSEMKKIGCLPLLEVLKLNWCGDSKRESEWIVREGEFPKLKLLSLEYPSGLMGWRVENNDSPFPQLQKLILEGIKIDLEIISCLEYSSTLLSIHMNREYSEVLVESVRELQRCLEVNGNEDVKVYLDYKLLSKIDEE